MQATRTANEVDQMVKEAIRLWKLIRALEQAARQTESILNAMVAALPQRAMEVYIQATEED